jgi:hypothetical protein
MVMLDLHQRLPAEPGRVLNDVGLGLGRAVEDRVQPVILDGRKRPLVVDSMGLLLAVLVTAANVDDAKPATEVFARLEGQPMSRVGRMYAGGAGSGCRSAGGWSGPSPGWASAGA